MINVFWILIQILIGYNLILPIILYLIGYGKKTTILKLSSKEYDYAIIVTAYEDTSHLYAVVNSILDLHYDRYLVYVVGDNCDLTGLHFNSDKVILLKPENVLANNISSHLYAIERFERNHEILTIIDSDNLVHTDYLNELNVFFNQGFKSVQGIRKAKSLTTPISHLDAIRDMYYHYYDGQILFSLGSSATLSGSGMAFKTNLYKASIRNLKINGAGFDKALQANIVKKNIRIAFAPRAIVYDEKTKSSKQLINQRSRWINAWFKYFGLGFNLIGIGGRRRQINPLLFGIVLIRPPLFIFLSLSFFCMLINLVINPVIAFIWLIAFMVFIFSFYLAIRKQENYQIIYRALWSLPKFVLLQFLALFFAKNANKRSVATKHHVDL